MTMQSDLDDTTSSPVKAAASTAQDQFHSLVDQGRGEWQKMMSDRSRQAADGLRRLGDQLGGLSTGRADEAPRLQQYLGDAQQRVSAWAGRLDQGGFDGMMRDVQHYARRRPGMFLLGAAGAGFLMGRAFKVGASGQPGTDGSRPFTPDRTGPTFGEQRGSSTLAPASGLQNGVQGSGSGGWPEGAGVVR